MKIKNVTINLLLFLSTIILSYNNCYSQSSNITPPSLTNNPSFDVICTNSQPLLTFYNAKGGIGELTYTIQISTDQKFENVYAEYNNIVQKTRFITSKLLDNDDKLPIDKQYYYWRVKATDSKNNESSWASSRFYLDTKSDDSFMNLIRVKVESVVVSNGANSKNIIDITDIGNTTHWEPPPPYKTTPWVEFTLSEPTEISRIWMLSNPNSKEGWLTNFYWMI